MTPWFFFFPNEFLLIIKCIPCMHTDLIQPTIALFSLVSTNTITQSLPTLDTNSLIASLLIVSYFASLDLNQFAPLFSLEECDCD